jgi:hypothetical protein
VYLPYRFVMFGCLDVVESSVCIHGEYVEACVSLSRRSLWAMKAASGFW